MDVRLDAQMPGAVLRQTVVERNAERSKEAGAEAELAQIRSEEERPPEPKAKPVEPPKVMSREELQQFLLMLGTVRGSEQLLSMMHDQQRMRGALLSKKS